MLHTQRRLKAWAEWATAHGFEVHRASRLKAPIHLTKSLGTKRDRDKRRKWESLATNIKRKAGRIVSNQGLKFRYDEISRPNNLVVQNKGVATAVSTMRGPKLQGPQQV
ncbi:hypothetical protein TNCV_2297531 [Trichonephila clavipes]|nr:hypothetical protein TNCV_2297531 [Trichonephila clavipes]